MNGAGFHTGHIASVPQYVSKFSRIFFGQFNSSFYFGVIRQNKKKEMQKVAFYHLTG